MIFTMIFKILKQRPNKLKRQRLGLYFCVRDYHGANAHHNDKLRSSGHKGVVFIKPSPCAYDCKIAANRLHDKVPAAP